MFEKFGNFGKKIVRVGVLGATLAGGAGASQFDIATKQKAAIETIYNNKIKNEENATKKAKLEDKKAEALARADVDIAKGKDADEKEKTATPAKKDIDSFRNDKRDLKEKYSEETIEQPIYDKEGNVIGHRKMVKKDGTKGTVRNQNNVNVGYNPNESGYYNNNVYYNDNGNRLRDIPPPIGRTPSPENVDTGSRLRGN